MSGIVRQQLMNLGFQNYIETPPVSAKQMYQASCQSDAVTLDTWMKTWISNCNENHKRFGSFKEHGLGKLFNVNKHKPAIVIGSGPSLKHNAEHLKNRDGILALSCLHNYHFFEDREIPIDYYVTLDAGPVVIEEVFEGGKKTEEEYWESTKNKKLIAFISTDPGLFKKWQGEVYLFTAPIAEKTWQDNLAALEPFHTTVSNGGNVLGACLYIAKGIMGSNPIAFMGADFAFEKNSDTGNPKFHSWDSKYDAKIGNVVGAVDVFGNKTLTWPSYYGFKSWFDSVTLTVNGIYINCTEGGIFGSYMEGNLMSLKQMTLKDFLLMYSMNEAIRAQCESPEKFHNMLLF
jgi:hypothetical protein